MRSGQNDIAELIHEYGPQQQFIWSRSGTLGGFIKYNGVLIQFQRAVNIPHLADASQILEGILSAAESVHYTETARIGVSKDHAGLYLPVANVDMTTYNRPGEVFVA